MTKEKIIYIDDDDIALKRFDAAFKAIYDIEAITCPDEAIGLLRRGRPDLLLVSVDMNSLSAYDLCRELRAADDLVATPILFVSKKGELVSELDGYDVGCDGYLYKPFDLNEANKAIKSALLRQAYIKGIQNKLEVTEELAFRMSQNVGEMGEVMKYASALSSLRDIKALLKTTFSALQQFGLSVTVLIRVKAGDIVARSNGNPIKKMEAELLEMASRSTRIVSYGKKYLFCAKRSAILVKNMPCDDEPLLGRLSDHLAIMIQMMDNAIELIEYKEKEDEQKMIAVMGAESAVSEEFYNIKKHLCKLNAQAQSTVNTLSSKVEYSFLNMGLTEEQESELTSHIEDARQEIEQYLDSGEVLKDAMDRVSSSIQHYMHGGDQKAS